MLRSAALNLTKVCRGAMTPMSAVRAANIGAVRHSSAGIPDIYDPEFDNRYEAYFNRPDIDGWEIRKAFNDLHGMDLVPEPKIVVAALKACRRLNDYALTVRYLESLKDKCLYDPSIYKWLLNEIQPTLKELGVSTPDELGYGVPELALKRPHQY